MCYLVSPSKPWEENWNYDKMTVLVVGLFCVCVCLLVFCVCVLLVCFLMLLVGLVCFCFVWLVFCGFVGAFFLFVYFFHIAIDFVCQLIGNVQT